MSSQGEKKIFLEADQKGYPVRAAGDFVYVRSAANPIRVIIDGQPITMEAGEKRRVPRSEAGRLGFDSFEVDNLSANAQSITLVVGEGDYEKLIVSGELNASAFVSTSANGHNPALPSDITKTIGLINTTKQSVVQGSVKQVSADTTGGGFAFATFYYGGEYYGLDADNLYTLDSTAAPFKAVQAINWGAINKDVGKSVVSVAVTVGGTVYFRHGTDLYRFSLLTLNVELLIEDEFSSASSVLGGAIIGDNFYFYEKIGNVRYVVVYSISNDNFSSWTHDNIQGLFQLFTMNDGFLYLTGNGSSTSSKFSISGEYIGDDVAFGGQGGTVLSPDGAIAVVGNLTTYVFKWAKDEDYYGEIYIESVGDATTRQLILLDEYFEFVARLGKTLMTGRVVRQIARLLSQTEGADYLDAIVALEWTDGFNVRKVSGGTQTWALRGIADSLSILLDSEFTITVLPEYI